MQRSEPGSSTSVEITLDDSDDGAEPANGEICAVCGESQAAMHYGAIACVGCKGFFRRALMKADQLECLADGDCVINKDLRTNCRCCRFQKCLKAGMKPAAVRPNREISSRQKKKALAMPEQSIDCTNSKKGDDWLKKMPVEQRTSLMQLLNIEAKIMKLYPLKVNTLRELIEDPSLLKGKRSEMRYEPYRMAKNDELCSVAYRRVIAAIDWVEHLSELLGGLSTEDKIALVKNCFAPLMVFKFATRTAEVAKDVNILCLCNFCFVPRNISSAFADSYHLGNGLVGRALDELVAPFRAYGLREEEIVCVSAMIALNPLARDLSADAFDKVMELRNRIQDTLYHVVKEARLSPHPSICFGHLLLSLPTVTCIANTMCENLQFAQTFSAQGEVALLTDLFGCFPVEPFDETTMQIDCLALSPMDSLCTKNDKTTQTEKGIPIQRKRKRPFMGEPSSPSPSNFRLLQAPAAFTLTEMFDDIYGEATSPEKSGCHPTSSSSNLPNGNNAVTRSSSLPDSVGNFQNRMHSTPPPSTAYYPNCYNPSWNNGY